MFTHARLKRGVIVFVVRIDLQLIDPAAIVRRARLRAITPLGRDVRRDPEQIALRIVDRYVITVATQAVEHFLREIVHAAFGRRVARSEPAANGIAPTAELDHKSSLLIRSAALPATQLPPGCRPSI